MMRRVRPDLETIRQTADDIKVSLEKKFPRLEIEYADWLELLERVRHGEVPDVIELDFGADAYMWIRGEPKAADKACTFAYNLESERWDHSEVILRIETRDTIWCRKTGEEDVRSLDRPPLYEFQDKSGVRFLCWVTEPHEHEWGRLKPKQSVGS